MDIIGGVSRGYVAQSVKVHSSTKNTEHDECSKYYDVLYDFTKTMFRINDKAADGEEPKSLQGQCRRLLPAFILLCGDVTKEIKPMGRPKKEPQPEPKPKPKTVLQVNLKVRDAWGLCPKCGGKCIKVKEDTILVNYPMYCKHCKSESVVSWKKKQ